MEREKVLIFIFLTVCQSIFCPEGFSGEHSWVRSSNGIFETRAEKITSFGPNLLSIAVATPSRIFIRNNNQKDFKDIFSLISNKNVNDIFYDQNFFEGFFVCSGSGLYQSSGFNDWHKLMAPSDDERFLSVISYNNKVYVGTSSGIVRMAANKGRLIKEGFIDLNRPVYSLLKDNTFIYAVTDERILKIKDNVIENIFSLKNNFSDDSQDEATNNEKMSIKAACILNVDKDAAVIFTLTDKGIFFSEDQGKHWDSIPADNILLDQVTSFIPICHGQCNDKMVDRLVLVVGTKKGAFLYEMGKWGPLYKGMETVKVNDMAIDGNWLVYAATDKGVYYFDVKTLPSFIPTEEPSKEIYVLTKAELEKMEHAVNKYGFEPSINEVHAWAIEYADVNKEKIDNWRRLAAKKAWFPKIAIGLDQDKNKTMSDSIWGSYSSGGQHYIGPDDKTFYDNLGWDVSLSWDIGETIWSGDQTSIDSRSKMMVELREDILAQVSRIYYERRRLQIEMDMGEVEDFASLIDKDLRIKELTSLIDSYTQGKFSKEIILRKNGSAYVLYEHNKN